MPSAIKVESLATVRAFSFHGFIAILATQQTHLAPPVVGRDVGPFMSMYFYLIKAALDTHALGLTQGVLQLVNLQLECSRAAFFIDARRLLGHVDVAL